jgi:hypothetical protein
MTFVSFPVRISLCATPAMANRNPHSATVLVTVHMVNQTREKLSEILKMKKHPTNKKITCIKFLIVEISILE